MHEKLDFSQYTWQFVFAIVFDGANHRRHFVHIFKTFLTKRALVRAAYLALPLVALPACDLFNQAKSAVETAAQIPIDVQQSTKVSFDVGQALGPTAGQTTPVKITQDLPLPAVPVDLNKDQPNLAKYANGHVVTVEINKIAVTPTTNTMTADLPSLDIYFGPANATKASDGIKVATIPSIPKGSTAAVDAIIDTAAMKTAGTQYLAKLAFAEIMTGKLVVEAGSAVPTGKIDLKLDLGVHAVVTPL